MKRFLRSSMLRRHGVVALPACTDAPVTLATSPELQRSVCVLGQYTIVSLSRRVTKPLNIIWRCLGRPIQASCVCCGVRVDMSEGGGAWSEAWRGSSTDAKIGDLRADTQYSFRVAAVNAVGEGPCSGQATCRTLLNPPQAPCCISVHVSEE
jgi:hypothetical protein